MKGKEKFSDAISYYLMYASFFIILIANIINIRYELYDLMILFYSSLVMSLISSYLSSLLFKEGSIHKFLTIISSIFIGVMMGSAIAYSFYLLKE